MRCHSSQHIIKHFKWLRAVVISTQLCFTAQRLWLTMPAHKRVRITLGELADRVAEEETRRLASEFGISPELRVTCRPQS